MENTSENLLLNRYQIIEQIGQGGYGRVIHAYDTRLKREVAIKEILFAAANSPEIETDGGDAYNSDSIPGLDEARAAGKLNDSNIVAIYDCVVEDNKVYVIEEYVEGITLTSLLRLLDDEITLDIVAAVFRGVAHAIMVAHKKNLLHLDIKPDNVIIGRGGEVKVADFGLATLMDINGEGRANAGTIGYMPLEQLQQGTLDVRSDEWSLAMLTYYMLCGSNPFVNAKTPAQAENLMCTAELTCPSACWDGVEEGIDDVLFKALSLEPDDRFQTVKEFYDALKGYLGKQAQGKREIATIVNGNDDAVIDTSTVMLPDDAPAEVRNLYPFIDRIGRKGSLVVMKILSMLSVCAITALSLVNFRLDATYQFGLLTNVPVVFAVLVIVPAVLCIFKVQLGFAYSHLLLSVMLIYNKCYIFGILLLLITTIYTRYMFKHTEKFSFACLMQPLFGGIGLSSISIALSGALLNRRDALIGSAFVCISAFVFACLGSNNIFNWEVAGNYLLPANVDIASSNINSLAISLLQSPKTYVIFALWIASAFIFSLFCSFGKVGFDILGAVLCSILLFASAIFPGFAFGGEVDALNVVNACVGSLTAIMCAVLQICDRVRVEKGAW